MCIRDRYDPKTEKEKLSIEEVPGQVYPTQEVEHYTMAHESEPESGQAANGKPSNSLNTDPAPGESGAQVSASPESAAETQPATQAPQETEDVYKRQGSDCTLPTEISYDRIKQVVDALEKLNV